MTSGQIAALAVVLLVLVLCILLIKLMKLVAKLSQSVRILTRDADDITTQTNRILSASNDLLNEINRKIKIIDPVFEASAKVGQSVANANDAINGMVHKIRRHHRMKWLYRLTGAIIGWTHFHKSKSK